MTEMRNGILTMALFSVIAFSCKEEKTIVPGEVPDNPYDTIDYGNGIPDDSVDAASFVGLHKYIFSTTCAVPGCHDGSFEPDFRTIESAYNTLVYHPVVKNDTGNNFEYRVVPGDAPASWLHERITTEDEVLGRMPLYDSLSPEEIQRITEWIEDGAEDPFGNSPVLPTYYPTFFGMLVYENDTLGMRYDTMRADIVEPMEFPTGKLMDVWIGLADRSVDGNYQPAFDFTYNKYKISNHLFDYTFKPEKSLVVEPAANPFMGPNPFGGTEKLPYYHHFVINTSQFPLNQVQYFRVYVQDADHSTPTEIPSGDSPFYLLTYFSFIVR